MRAFPSPWRPWDVDPSASGQLFTKERKPTHPDGRGAHPGAQAHAVGAPSGGPGTGCRGDRTEGRVPRCPRGRLGAPTGPSLRQPPGSPPPPLQHPRGKAGVRPDSSVPSAPGNEGCGGSAPHPEGPEREGLVETGCLHLPGLQPDDCALALDFEAPLRALARRLPGRGAHSSLVTAPGNGCQPSTAEPSSSSPAEPRTAHRDAQELRQ